MLSKELQEKMVAVNKQYNFCVQLMDHFANDIERRYKDAKDYPNYEYKRFDGRSQLVNDIIRIRRELSTLCKLLEKTGW